MSKLLKANIVSLFLALSAEDQKEVLANLTDISKQKPTEGGRNISEEKL